MSDNFNQLRSFLSLNPDSFKAVIRKMGIASAACYQIKGDKIVRLVATVDDCDWPVTADYSPNYTTFKGFEPLGWTKANSDVSSCKDWPKGINFYFPEQEIFEEKFLISVKNSSGKRVKFGELNGLLEAIVGRIRHWSTHRQTINEYSDLGYKESIKAFGKDIQAVINHELRTPLSSIAGFIEVVQTLDPNTDKDSWSEYWQIINDQTAYALEAIEKLSYGMSNSHQSTNSSEATSRFNVSEEMALVCQRIETESSQIIVAHKEGVQTKVRFHRRIDGDCFINADRRLFNWAAWEVLKNAVIHSKRGEVEVEIYKSDNILVIDVIDDGQGISEGAEELVFLRFYQDPRTVAARKGKRGLGLGLFLARHIAERHMGQLRFVRHPEKGTIFRFFWPLAEDESLPKGA